jgi:protein associated with RNAse G/E
MTSTVVSVNSRKYDQSISRHWTGELVSRDDEIVVLKGVFDKDVEHPDLGHIVRGTISIEYFWLERWFNIFRFFEPSGSLRNFYCNITMPPAFDGRVLDYVDLDIDVVVWPDMSYCVLDEAEFKDNSALWKYPDLVKDNARKSLTDLLTKIKAGEFPFSETMAYEDCMRRI